MEFEAIHTPGHIGDHMAFLMTYSQKGSENKTTYLFSGDVIIGSSSTWAEDLPLYLKTLNKLKNEYAFDYACVAHSLSLKKDDTDNIITNGPKKLEEYIQYREAKIAKLSSIIDETY